MAYDKEKDSTTKEREENGANMSDERKLNEEMKREYSGEGQVDKAACLNKKEKERTEGSKMNEEEV